MKQQLMKISCLIISFIIILQFLPQNIIASEQKWGEKIQVTKNEFVDGFTSLIHDQNGTYWLAWNSDRNGTYEIFSDRNGKGDIFISRSINRRDWMTPVQVTKDSSDDITPSLIQDSKGTYWIAWASNSSGDSDIWICNSYDGINWGRYQQITKDGAEDILPCLIQDNNDKYWLVWSKSEFNNSDIWISSSMDGKNWDKSKKIIDHGLEDQSPCLIQDNDNLYRLTWESKLTEVSNLTDNFNIWICSSINGNIWGVRYPVTNNSNHNSLPSLIQDTTGKFWIAWNSDVRGPFGGYDIRISNSSDGKIWGNPRLIISNGWLDIAPSLIEDSNGKFLLAWSSSKSLGFGGFSNIESNFEIWICSTYMKDVDKDDEKINMNLLIISLIAVFILSGVLIKIIHIKANKR